MAQNDMHVIMYKILAYLYDCMKRGERPESACYAHDSDMLGIPYAYWAQVMREMSDHCYVRGFSFIKAADNIRVKAVDPAVTIEGVEFLSENSAMQRALDYLKEAKSALPFI